MVGFHRQKTPTSLEKYEVKELFADIADIFTSRVFFPAFSKLSLFKATPTSDLNPDTDSDI